MDEWYSVSSHPIALKNSKTAMGYDVADSCVGSSSSRTSYSVSNHVMMTGVEYTDLQLFRSHQIQQQQEQGRPLQLEQLS